MWQAIALRFQPKYIFLNWHPAAVAGRCPNEHLCKNAPLSDMQSVPRTMCRCPPPKPPVAIHAFLELRWVNTCELVRLVRNSISRVGQRYFACGQSLSKCDEP